MVKAIGGFLFKVLVTCFATVGLVLTLVALIGGMPTPPPHTHESPLIPVHITVEPAGQIGTKDIQALIAHPGRAPYWVPTDINVGLVHYRITWAQHKDLQRLHSYAASSLPYQTIWLDDERDVNFTRAMLLHEIMHQVREVGSTWQQDDNLDTESFIQSEDKGLALVLRDNPQVLAFLGGKE